MIEKNKLMAYTGIPHFIVLCFTALCWFWWGFVCFVLFFELKVCGNPILSNFTMAPFFQQHFFTSSLSLFGNFFLKIYFRKRKQGGGGGEKRKQIPRGAQSSMWGRKGLNFATLRSSPEPKRWPVFW